MGAAVRSAIDKWINTNTVALFEQAMLSDIYG